MNVSSQVGRCNFDGLRIKIIFSLADVRSLTAFVLIALKGVRSTYSRWLLLASSRQKDRWLLFVQVVPSPGLPGTRSPP